MNLPEPTSGIAPRIGTAGWSIPREHASLVPGFGLHLARYAQALPCTEINSSFYRSHRISTWTRWAESVPPNFRFSVKAPKAITHDSQLDGSLPQLPAFLDEIRILGDKLGPLLFQLPPKVEFDLHRATEFFSILRELHPGPAALEPRHPSWFTPSAAELLQTFRVARAAADPALTHEASQPGGCRELTYFRLHGSPRKYYSSYSQVFLASLAAAIRIHAPDSEVWCIFDNTASGAALGNALDLHRLLNPHPVRSE